MARRYSEEEVKELEEGWDKLIAFKEFVLYRLGPGGIKRFRDINEIEGDTYDWMENKFGSMIETYSSMRGLPFEDAQMMLMNRPYAHTEIIQRWKKYFKDGETSLVGARENPAARLQVKLKTSKAGWNTWTFTLSRIYKMKVWERADKLYQADGVSAVGVGETLSGAVQEIYEKQVEYMKRNDLQTDRLGRGALQFIEKVINYFKTQVEV